MQADRSKFVRAIGGAVAASVIIAVVVFAELVGPDARVHQAAAQSQSPAPAMALHHAGISVPDAEAASAWYQDMLGFEEVARVSDPSVPTDIIQIERDGVRIELFEVPNSAPLPEYRRDPTEDLRTQGVKHFGLKVADVRALLAELEAKGVTVTKGVTENPRNIFVFISDNAGNSIELIQPKQ